MAHGENYAEPLKNIKSFHLIEAYMGQNVCDVYAHV